MSDETEASRRTLVRVLTWGLNEIQGAVVVPGSARRVQDLANTLEVIPPMLARPVTDEDLAYVLDVFRTFLRQYPDTPYPYVAEIEAVAPAPAA
jgi:hypothetical protein